MDLCIRFQISCHGRLICHINVSFPKKIDVAIAHLVCTLFFAWGYLSFFIEIECGKSLDKELWKMLEKQE